VYSLDNVVELEDVDRAGVAPGEPFAHVLEQLRQLRLVVRADGLTIRAALGLGARLGHDRPTVDPRTAGHKTPAGGQLLFVPCGRLQRRSEDDRNHARLLHKPPGRPPDRF